MLSALLCDDVQSFLGFLIFILVCVQNLVDRNITYNLIYVKYCYVFLVYCVSSPSLSGSRS